jgi:hypothetical protein
LSKIELGSLKIDPVQLGSQGNAILGIRDSGKSYTATYLAERLFEADIPFIAFDPIGIWRFLRVPGGQRGGKGYPVVVAGGKEGDLPLTESGAPEIVRAAMRNGVSLVIDLFDINLSKSAWRRIVTQCVRALLHENQAHGLRHVFLEEAAEFIPQKPNDWDVYNELEKLARMGGNSRLGYTLINQRSQEVSKAILELCENIFLHRQRGKNALENLDKWLSVAGADERLAILKSLPDLPQGDCWAWIGGDKPRPPTLVHVPRKNSLHPDRRVMRGDIATKPKNAVDVGKFVAGMKSTLVEVEELDKANNPVLLRKRIAELEAAAKKAPAPVAPIDKPAEKKAAAEREAKAHIRGKVEGYGEALKAVGAIFRDLAPTMAKVKPLVDVIETNGKAIEGWASTIKEKQAELAKQLPPSGSPTERPSAHAPIMRAPSGHAPAVARKPSPAANGDGTITQPLQRIIDAIRWWNVMGVAAPSQVQVGFIAGYSHKSGTWSTYLGRARTLGLIDGRGDLVLTAEGLAAVNEPDAPPSGEQLRATVLAKIDTPLRRILTPILEVYPNALSQQQAGEAAGYSPASGTWSTYLGRARSLDLIEGRGELKAQGWLFP